MIKNQFYRCLSLFFYDKNEATLNNILERGGINEQKLDRLNY